MLDLINCLTNILHYYISILALIHQYFVGDIYLFFFGICSSLLTDSKLFCEVFQTFVILSAILLPVKSAVASVVF